MLNLLKRFVRYIFAREAAYDRGWTTGYDEGYQEARETVAEWCEPPERS